MHLRIRKQIIQALSEGDMPVYHLIDMQDASLPEFFEILNQMGKEGLIKIGGGKISLGSKKDPRLENMRQGCECCDSTGYQIRGPFEKVLRKYGEIAGNRPEAIEQYDQGFISIEGIVRRISFIYERGDLLDNKIFVVGDDDLFSIAASLTGLPEFIQVCEIDERLVLFINRVAEEFGLPVNATVFDVQQPLPGNFSKKFDIFVMDPVETIPGLNLFLSRGASALKGAGCSGYFGITTLEASRTKWYEIEKNILDMGFVITDLKRRFSVYPQEDKNFFRYQDKMPITGKFGEMDLKTDWYTSTLYRIEAVKEPRPIVKGKMVIDEEVYKDDESWATPY